MDKTVNYSNFDFKSSIEVLEKFSKPGNDSKTIVYKGNAIQLVNVGETSDSHSFFELKEVMNKVVDKATELFSSHLLSKNDYHCLGEGIANLAKRLGSEDLTNLSKTVFERENLDVSESDLSDTQSTRSSSTDSDFDIMDENDTKFTSEEWKQIIEAIGCPVSDYIRSLSQIPELTDDMRQLLQLEMTPDSMRQLIEWRTEFDKLLFEQAVDEARNQPHPLPVFKNRDELFSLTQEFSQRIERVKDSKAITSLRLFGKQISTLPPKIGRLKYLTMLYLPNNQITKIPSEVAQIPNLKRVEIWGNPLLLTKNNQMIIDQLKSRGVQVTY